MKLLEWIKRKLELEASHFRELSCFVKKCEESEDIFIEFFKANHFKFVVRLKKEESMYLLSELQKSLEEKS